MKPQGFPRERRILKRGDYLRVQREGWRAATRYFVFLLRPNELPHNRLGLVVSAKVGKAHVRNRIKRVLREVFRRTSPLEGLGLDMVVIPRPALPKEAPYALAVDSFQEMERRYRKQVSEPGESR